MAEVEGDIEEENFSAEVEQVRFRQLLKEPMFKTWFRNKPKLTAFTGEKVRMKWRVYGKKDEDSRWRRKDVNKWKDGYALIVKMIKGGWHDMTLMCPNQAFRPPVVTTNGKRAYLKIVPEGHEWCGYCRRPTIFKRFAKHHAMGSQTLGSEPRCTICGIRSLVLKKYSSANQGRG